MEPSSDDGKVVAKVPQRRVHRALTWRSDEGIECTLDLTCVVGWSRDASGVRHGVVLSSLSLPVAVVAAVKALPWRHDPMSSWMGRFSMDGYIHTYMYM